MLKRKMPLLSRMIDKFSGKIRKNRIKGVIK
ncbi:hypothetical protein CHY_0558 [Carboxydothermus hydrogenoformans Z-2901]|uniref:Uncharacterized protein n=1 Tax=Carboxydothermus hydrogenoformans (strain ATCC BAA-161 / DSM 6008 / Z-2901) TaxID=246194 RepID=Q3AEL8_CARHZ|nr:hypothetical protein CHY_0558 [Carboxydothermus hydrogenoformans Z-2901]